MKHFTKRFLKGILIPLVLTFFMSIPHPLSAKRTDNFVNDGLVLLKTDKNINIHGRVFDDAEPPVALIGVGISIKNTDVNSITDVNGFFSIKAKKGDILVFSYLGFKDFEFVITRSLSNLNISMTEDSKSLDEVVVTGFSEEKKLNTISAVSNLKISANIANKPITSLSQALQGGITGIDVSQGSGLPGADAASIKIRGISTLGDSNPLVLVDGIPMSMDNLDPTTIESVTVLKDASAAAIYGSRAANGVIVIKTKRGKAGKVRVSYNAYYGVQKATYLPDFVDGSTYLDIVNKAYINIGGDPIYTQEAIDATRDHSDPVTYPDTDWRNKMYKDGSIQSHSLSVSGGSSVARFSLTANYQKQDGLIDKTNFNRLSIRANTSVSLADNLSINMDFNSYRRTRREAMYRDGEYSSSILNFMSTTAPNVIGRYPNKEGVDLVYYGNVMEMRNPVAMIDRGGHMEALEDNVSINIQPRWEIIPNLILRGQYSYRVSSTAKKRKRLAYNFFDYNSDALIYTWDAINAASQNRSSYYYAGGTLEYTMDLNKHRLFAIAGINQEMTSSGNWDEYTMRAFFGKVNYTFDKKYLLEATIRCDGSSRFGPDNKYGYFPSLAAGWNVSEESFMKKINWLDNMKLRASYGLLGNENIGLYKYQSLINASSGVETIFGNPDITWEKVEMFDVGVDFSFLNDFSITFDYYDKLTKDMIISPPISWIGGIGSVPINSGKVRNRGWEFDFKYSKALNRNLYLDTHLGFSHNKNTIESLFGGPYDNGSTINKVGYALNSHYVYETDGLLQEEDFSGKDSDGKWIAKDGVIIFDGQQPGDIHYLDQDGDDKITTEDRVIKGTGQPDLSYFGNFSLNYKKMDFEILLQGVAGVDAYYSGVYKDGLLVEGNGRTPITANLDYWTKENTNARYPRLAPKSDYGNNHHQSDYWFFDSSYCRVKYIQLGYTFDQKKLLDFGIRSIRAYFNAQNPFTIAKDDLVDPENRGGVSTYPLLKTYSMGVSVNFN